MGTKTNVITDVETVEAQETTYEPTKQVTRLVNNDGHVNLSLLTDEQKKKCLEVTAKLDSKSVGSVSNYGVGLTSKLAETGNSLLSFKTTRNKKIDAIIKDIMHDLNRINLNDLREPNAFHKWAENVPILRKLITTIQDKITSYNTVKDNIESMSDEIAKSITIAYAENQELQQVFDGTTEYISNLETLIIAGDYRYQIEKEKLDKMMSVEDDQMAILRQQTFVKQIEKRLDTLRSVRLVAKAQQYEIYLTQQTNLSIAEAARDLQDVTLGAFTTQLKVLVALANQRDSINLLNSVRDGANKAIVETAKTLESNVADMVTFSNQSAFDIKSIEQAATSIKNALKTATEIENKASAQRQERLIQYAKIEEEIDNIGKNTQKSLPNQDTAVSGIRLIEDES